MSDWKSQYGVSDQGASNAGVYGSPNSTWDIARAQEETLKLQQSHWGQTSITGLGGTSYSPMPPPAAYPTGDYAYSESSGCLKAFVALVVIGIAVALLPVYLPAILGMASSLGATHALDTAHYEGLSAEARGLSTQPTSRLYNAYLKKASPEWASLTPKQQAAVAAAWIRYTRDPAAFEKLAPAQKAYVFAAFDRYLRTLAATGDRQAARDLERLPR